MRSRNIGEVLQLFGVGTMGRDIESVVASYQYSNARFSHALNGLLCRLKLCGVALMLRTAGFKTKALVISRNVISQATAGRQIPGPGWPPAILRASSSR